MVLTALTGLSLAQSLRSAGAAEDQTNQFGRIERMPDMTEITRTTACPTDTLIYGLYKNPSNLISGVFYRDSGNLVSIAGQWYPADQDVSVSGVEFLADVPTETGYTVDVEVSIWNVGADSLPVGSALATTTVTVDSGFVFRYASFSPAVDISAGNGYAVTLYTPDQDTAVLFRSNRISDSEGEGELNGIVGAFLGGAATPTFFKSTELTVGGNPYDVDMYIFPIVNYSINADFVGPADCAPQGEEVEFINTSLPVSRSRYYNRFFAFTTWINPGAANETFLWVPVPGDSITTASDTVPYTFSTGLTNYDVFLDVFHISMTGTRACFDDTTISVTSGVAATADFQADADTSLTVSFTDFSLLADSVAYSFGDGASSTDANPTHTYASFGTYSVTQIAYNACGNDTTTVSITLTEPVTGIQTLSAADVRVFPNPSQGLFNVEVAVPGDVTLRVFNLVGQEILRSEAASRATLDLSGQEAGLYLLQGEVDGKRFTQRLIVE